MQSNPAVQHRVLGTCVCILLFLSLLFHDTGDVVLQCTDTYARHKPAIANALDAYNAGLPEAQLAADCLISGLDRITDFATRLLRSAGIIEPPPVPDHFFISKKALNECFDRCGKRPVNRPVPSRAWAQRNRAGTLEALGSPTPTTPEPLLSTPRLVSSPLAETALKTSPEVCGSLNSVRVSEKAILSEGVDTSSSTFKPRKADYWSTVPSAQAIAPAPKTGLRRQLGATVARREAARLDTIAEDFSESTIPGSNTTSTLIATSPSPITPPATANTAIERPAGACAKDAPGEPRTPRAALSTQVDKMGLFGKLRLKVAAAVASASRPRPIVQAQDLSDSTTTISSDAPTHIATSSAEGTEDKPNKVVTFSDEVQVRDVPVSIWDELARREFISKEVEARIEVAYWAWVEEEKKVVPRVWTMLKTIRAKINARRFATSGR